MIRLSLIFSSLLFRRSMTSRKQRSKRSAINSSTTLKKTKRGNKPSNHVRTTSNLNKFTKPRSRRKPEKSSVLTILPRKPSLRIVQMKRRRHRSRSLKGLLNLSNMSTSRQRSCVEFLTALVKISTKKGTIRWSLSWESGKCLPVRR